MAIPLSFIRELARRLAGTFRRGRSDADLQDELRFHLEMTAESNRRAGEPAKEAARRAAIMCGGVAQAIEAQRDQRGLRWLTDLVRDIHYGWRGLIRRRAITMIAVLSMALGISVTAMVFSLANHVFLRPLPGTDHPEQLVRFRWDGHIAPDPIRFNSNGPYAFSPEVLARLRDRSSSLSSMFAYAQMGRVTASIDGQAEVLPEVEVVSGNYFASLGVHPALGRAITPTDDQPGASPVALISYRYWQSRFASESAVIGKTISVGDVSVTIVGITPLAFAGLGPVGASPAVFVPLGLAPLFQPREDPARLLKGNGLWWVQIGARLRPGAAADQARAHLEPVFQQAALEGASAQGVRWSPRADQVSNGFQTPRLIVEPDGLGLPADESFIDALVILASIAGTVLLVACINLSSLLLSRATVRRKEMGVRLALGAGRGRLLRQLLTESVLLSSLGGLLAVLLLQWTSDLLRRMFGADIEVAFDWRVGGFTGTIAVLSGLCVGAIPALRATQHNISAGLAGGMRDQAGHGRSGWAKGLIVAQIALSLVLLTGAGLLVRTLRNLHLVDPGFNVSQLLLFEAEATAALHSSAEAARRYREIAASIAALPGIESVTFSDHPVLSGGGNSYGIRVAGFNGGKETPAAANAVGPDFFKTLQIPVLYGRDIEGRDEGAGRTSHVVVVNQSFARKFFGRDDAIGGATRFGEVVGVVSDARDSDLKRVEPTFYVPFQHAPFGSPTGARASFAVRLAGSPPALIRSIHQVVSEIDPALALDDVRTQDEHVARLVSQERLFAEVGGFCGVVAAALACVGLFGLIAYSVQQRTTEIGIRVALGAQPWRVMRMILHDALWLLGVGVLLGLVGAMLSLRLVSSLLYGLSFTDPLTYGVVTLLFMAVAIGACLLPARRAARVDPVIALRSE